MLPPQRSDPVKTAYLDRFKLDAPAEPPEAARRFPILPVWTFELDGKGELLEYSAGDDGEYSVECEYAEVEYESDDEGDREEEGEEGAWS